MRTPFWDFWALRLRAPEICGSAVCLPWRSFDMERYLMLLRQHQSSEDTARPDPGHTMDIFPVPVWVIWSMSGDLEEQLYCCHNNLFSALIHSDVGEVQVLEAGRPGSSSIASWPQESHCLSKTLILQL